MITFEIENPSYSVIVDDENVVTESVYLHESQGHLIIAEGEICVVWEDGDYLYTVSGKVNLREELIEIAKRCIKINVGD